MIQEPILLLDNYWYSNLSHDTLDTTPNILLYSNWYSNLYVMILLIQQPILLLCITRYSNSYVMTLLIQQQRNHYIYTLDTTNSWYSNLKYDTWYNNQYIITHHMIHIFIQQPTIIYTKWYSNYHATMLLTQQPNILLHTNWISNLYVTILLIQPITLLYIYQGDRPPAAGGPPPMRIPGAARRTPSQLSKTMSLYYHIVFFCFCYFVLLDICHSEDP